MYKGIGLTVKELEGTRGRDGMTSVADHYGNGIAVPVDALACLLSMLGVYFCLVWSMPVSKKEGVKG